MVVSFQDTQATESSVEAEAASMVKVTAKWNGRCKRCGKPIPLGAVIDWTKDGGAVHLTPEECERAPAKLPEPVMRGPQPEDPEERMIAVELLLGHPWKSATSKKYEKLPHQYSLRRHWDADDFLWVAEYIQRVGYQQYFIGRTWVYYDIGDMQYWNCDGPLEQSPLINRAVRREAKK